MSRIIKICLGTVFCRYNIAFFTAVSVLTTVMLAFYNIPTVLLHGIQESKTLSFGSFAALCVSEDSSEITAKYGSDVGIITVSKTVTYEERELTAGSIDDEAFALSGIRLLTGRLPAGENEIAMTESAAAYTGVNINASLTLDGSSYVIVGIMTDYGRLWVRGGQDYETPDIIVSPGSTAAGGHLYDVCLFRYENAGSEFSAIKNVNGLYKEKLFEAPAELMVMMYAAGTVIVYLLLALNAPRAIKQVSVYIALGMGRNTAVTVIAAGTAGLTLAGLLTGLVMSIIICVTAGIAFGLRDTLHFSFSVSHFLILTALFFISGALYLLKVSMASRGLCSGAQTAAKERKYKKHSAAVYITSAAVSTAMLSYGFFYDSYFSENVYEDVPGTMTKDFDFRFVTVPQPSAPGGGRVFMFTDSLEKDGADDSFIGRLESEPTVSKVSAYKENNKVMVITDNEVIDDYLDGFDFYLDGSYNILTDMLLIDMPQIKEHFGFGENERLAAAKLVGYPADKIEKIIELAGDKSVDINKLISGEEVILRVPSYCLIQNSDGSVRRVTNGMNGYTEETALSSIMFGKGDELRLCQLYSDKAYNGGVPPEEICNFRRKDKTVKIAAVIAEPLGLYHSGSFPRAYELLTVNDAFSALGFDASYGVVDIYADPGFTGEEASAVISSYAADVPGMRYENWTAQVKNYRLFNDMIRFFSVTFLAVIILTDLVFLSVELYGGISAKMRYFRLLWINGMPKQQLAAELIFFALKTSLATAVFLGVPLSFIMFGSLAVRAENDVMGSILYYFSPVSYIPVIAVHILMLTAAFIPGLRELYRGCERSAEDE